MKPVILNLDWGSQFLKASARLYPRRVTNPVGPAWQLAGKSGPGKIEAHQSLRSSGQASLKSDFLSGRISKAELESFSAAAERLVAEHVINPLLTKIRRYHPEGVEIHLNVHTPLQMEDPTAVDPKIFKVVNRTERLVGLRYQRASEWHEAAKRPAARMEFIWGTWLMDRTLAALKGQNVQVAMLPESLACVHELVGQLETNEDKQVVVLDIGDFTTDFALVAAHNLANQDRMVIRMAGSIFDSGHQAMCRKGFKIWLDDLMRVIHTRFDPTHLSSGIHAYCDLALLTVGGGAAALSREQLEIFRRRILEWAGRKPHFLEFHKVFLVFPSRRSEIFQVLGASMEESLDMQKVDLTVHVPSRNACVYADTHLSLRVAGKGPLDHGVFPDCTGSD